MKRIGLSLLMFLPLLWAQDAAAAAFEVQRTVNFARNSSELTDIHKNTLRSEVANLNTLLRYRPEITLEVAGHAGSGEKNATHLSEVRAQKVWEFLILEGLPAERMEPVGYGAQGVGSSGATARVELRVPAVDEFGLTSHPPQATPPPAVAVSPAAPTSAPVAAPPPVAYVPSSPAALPEPPPPVTYTPPPAPSLQLSSPPAATEPETAPVAAPETLPPPPPVAYAPPAAPQAPPPPPVSYVPASAEPPPPPPPSYVPSAAGTMGAAGEPVPDREIATRTTPSGEPMIIITEPVREGAASAPGTAPRMGSAPRAIPPPRDGAPRVSAATVIETPKGKLVDNQRAESYVKPYKATSGGRYFIEGTVYFGTRADSMTAASGTQLDTLARRLVRRLEAEPGLQLQIVGHADPLTEGSDAESLSQQRAQELARALSERGVPAGRISASGAGGTQPLAIKKNDPARDLNQRAEIRVPL